MYPTISNAAPRTSESTPVGGVAKSDRKSDRDIAWLYACGQMPAPLLIADVPWLLYRSFFALPKSIVGADGQPVNALLGTVNALLAIPSLATYAISKGGMKQLTSVAAVALAPHKIRVVAVGPGTILTEMVASAIFSSEDARRSVLSRTPIGRGGEPSEVASVVAFLASDDASYITGQTIYPDGGRLILNYTVPVKDK